MSGTAPARPSNRIIVSICGPSGVGKSQLAKVLVERLGVERSVRIPGDYYLLPACGSLEAYLTQPLHYDWTLLEATLVAPEGTSLVTPNFDFAHFRRRASPGGKTFTMRRIAILDTMYPYPQADLRILLTCPGHIRHARVGARDGVWGTSVLDRWDHLEWSRAHLEAMDTTYHVLLDGAEDLARNADVIFDVLHARFTGTAIVT